MHLCAKYIPVLCDSKRLMVRKRICAHSQNLTQKQQKQQTKHKYSQSSVSFG